MRFKKKEFDKTEDLVVAKPQMAHSHKSLSNQMSDSSLMPVMVLTRSVVGIALKHVVCGHNSNEDSV